MTAIEPTQIHITGSISAPGGESKPITITAKFFAAPFFVLSRMIR